MKRILNLFIVLFLCSSCAQNFLSNGKFQTLNLAFSSTEKELITEVKHKFGKKKLKIQKDKIKKTDITKALIDGELDVYIGSLDLPKIYQDQIDSYLIAKDAIVITSNKSNPVNNLSLKELSDIFARKTRNWKTFNKRNKPIVVVDSEQGDITREALYKNLFGISHLPIDDAVTVSSSSEVRQTINRFDNAISYLSFRNLNQDLKTLNINNVPATSINLNKGYFPLSRPIKVYFNKEHIKTNAKYPSLKKLLKFLHKQKGQGIISELKYMPLTEAELQLVELDVEPIYIGVAAPLEGAYIELGKSIINAAKLAVEEFNTKTDIDGQAIELIICNDKSTVSDALKCANKFKEAGVAGVIGHLTSQASIEASKIYVKNKIPQITPASTHPWFTERPGAKGHVFRTIGRDDKQAELIAEKISNLELAHPAKVHIFNNSTIYGSTLSTLIENAIVKKAQDKVLGITALEQSKNNFHKEIDALEAQVLVFVGEYGDAAQLVKSLALANKADVVFIGADGVFSHRFIEEAGLRAENAYVTGNTLNSNSEELEAFKQRFQERFKLQASSFAMNSYDASQILIQAIKNSELNSSTVLEEIKMIDHQGITGEINFDEFGDPIENRMCIYQVVDGKFNKA